MSEISKKKILQEGNWYHTFAYEDIKTKGTFNYIDTVLELNLPSFENKDVLDVGCSDGFFSKFFSDTLNAKSVIGIDINKYDGGVAFDVLNSYKEDFEKNMSLTMIFPY